MIIGYNLAYQDCLIRRGRIMGFYVSLFLHAFIFTAGSFVLVKSVEYGVEAGVSGFEVELVAAPQVVVQEEIVPEPPIQAPTIVQEEDILIPQAVAQKSAASDVSANLSQGAVTEVPPSYLRNPAPVYPLYARQLEQQGLVILLVSVDKTGRPIEVQVKTSSGFPLLDASASKALWKWRFNPARVGGWPIESTVEIPIRFQLENNN